MKIVYVGPFRFPSFDAAAARVLNNAKAFREQGHEVSFISWGGKYLEPDKNPDGSYSHDGFEYTITGELDLSGSILHKARQLLNKGCKTLRILESMSTKPDLIIAYNADYRLSKHLMVFCERNSIKLANDITEWYEYNEMYFFDRLPYYFNMKNLQHEIKNKIVISSYLDRYFCNSNNLLLPPLCDSSAEKWDKIICDDRVPAYDGVTLIYAGTPARKDCVHHVINAINELATDNLSVRFVIIGISKTDYIKRYGNLITAGELHDNIIFLGRVPQDDIPAYYKLADFMVLLREPTKKNMAGFPTKFAESMTAGVPVITNATSDLYKYVIEGQTGFMVPAPTVESLKKVLVDKVLICTSQTIKKMKSETSNITTSLFDYHYYSSSVNKFIDNLK